MGVRSAAAANGRKSLSQAPDMLPGYAVRPRGRLLVVEDDLCVREVVELFLSEKGYACTSSDNALAAIGHLEKDRFDLVVTDLHMPDMDGMALLEWIKARWPETRVMIITGDTDVEMKNHAIKKGVDSYLTKPFTIDQFFREVSGCIIKSPELESNPESLTS